MSNLLEQASLVMIPSGYKEDVVYSQIPLDGSGDLQLTRASNGTRINSAGLVEVCPWNLAEYSEDFSNAIWYKSNGVITANDTTAPNGTTTADKFGANGTLTSSYFFTSQYVGTNAIVGQNYTITLYAKAGTITQMLMYLGAQNGIYWNLSNGQFIDYWNGVQNITSYNSESVGNGWYKYTISIVASNTTVQIESYSSKNGNIVANYTTADNYYLWGAQLNIGATAKPYFPTTDRLNVPRLTYQNGGGGCPSLLLEKQSTNLVLYSQAFTNTWFTFFGTTTDNQVVSPDGTQNASKVILGASGAVLRQSVSGLTNGQPYTFSCYIKQGSGVTASLQIADVGSTITLTNDWVRYTYTANWNTSNNIVDIELTGANGSYCYIWGAQLEAGSYPTSYIPTTSSSATRVADACFKTGISSLIGQTEGVLFCQFNKPVDPLTVVRLSISDGSTANWVFVGFEGLILRAYLRANNTVIESQGFSTTSNVNKIAIAYKSGNYAIYHNGTQIATGSTTYSFSATLNQLNFGENPFDLTIYAIAQISQFELFPTRLTNAELQALTTL